MGYFGFKFPGVVLDIKKFCIVIIWGRAGFRERNHFELLFFLAQTPDTRDTFGARNARAKISVAARKNVFITRLSPGSTSIYLDHLATWRLFFFRQFRTASLGEFNEMC
jgi:hypothetical protein